MYAPPVRLLFGRATRVFRNRGTAFMGVSGERAGGRAGEGRVKRGGGGLDSRNRAKASPTPSAGRFFPHGRAGAILTILWPWNNGEKRGG